ncbi:MAG TPA: YbaB/EbfC family nucleoid-associated protein [bacterium]|nr:YbaB/EbfC family nucleoid-associated protein [bacterium]
MSKFNMAELFKQTQKIQEEVKRVQEALEDMTVEGTAGGGVVTVTANGKQKIISVKIDPEVVRTGDVEMLEDLISASVNQALENAQELANDEMQKVAGGLLGNLPMGGMKLPGFPM